MPLVATKTSGLAARPRPHGPVSGLQSHDPSPAAPSQVAARGGARPGPTPLGGLGRGSPAFPSGMERSPRLRTGQHGGPGTLPAEGLTGWFLEEVLSVDLACT